MKFNDMLRLRLKRTKEIERLNIKIDKYKQKILYYESKRNIEKDALFIIGNRMKNLSKAKEELESNGI